MLQSSRYVGSLVGFGKGKRVGNFLEGSRETSASSAVVWDILANVDAWPETFTPYLKEAHLEGDIEVGSKGWVQTKIPIPRSYFEITAVEDDRSWEWTGKIMWLTMRFDHVVETLDESRTMIFFDIDVDGPMAGVFRPLIRLQYRRNMNLALDTLVAEAEKASSP